MTHLCCALWALHSVANISSSNHQPALLTSTCLCQIWSHFALVEWLYVSLFWYSLRTSYFHILDQNTDTPRWFYTMVSFFHFLLSTVLDYNIQPLPRREGDCHVAGSCVTSKTPFAHSLRLYLEGLYVWAQMSAFFSLDLPASSLVLSPGEAQVWMEKLSV